MSLDSPEYLYLRTISVVRTLVSFFCVILEQTEHKLVV